MKHQLVDSGAEVMVIFAHSLEEIVANTPVKRIVITELGDQLGGMKRTVVNGVIRYVKKMVPRYHLTHGRVLLCRFEKRKPTILPTRHPPG